MWRKDEEKPQSPASVPPAASQHSSSQSSGNTGFGSTSSSSSHTPPVSSKAAACVSAGIKIKGEITGSEDLFIDGIVDGKVTVSNAVVTVGPNATVKAEIIGREVVVRGKVDGKLSGSERVQIWSTARVNGDVKAEKISIEEGAELHGKMEAGRQPEQSSDSSSRKSDSKSRETSQAPGAAVAGAN
jgi:cytoskeletal protein CcmA (bactofilin family)